MCHYSSTLCGYYLCFFFSIISQLHCLTESFPWVCSMYTKICVRSVELRCNAHWNPYRAHKYKWRAVWSVVLSDRRNEDFYRAHSIGIFHLSPPQIQTPPKIFLCFYLFELLPCSKCSKYYMHADGIIVTMRIKLYMPWISRAQFSVQRFQSHSCTRLARILSRQFFAP